MSYSKSIANTEGYTKCTSNSFAQTLMKSTSRKLEKYIISGELNFATNIAQSEVAFTDCYFLGPVHFQDEGLGHKMTFTNCFFDTSVIFRAGTYDDAIRFEGGEIQRLNLEGGHLNNLFVGSVVHDLSIEGDHFDVLTINSSQIWKLDIKCGKSKIRGYIHISNKVDCINISGTNENCNIELKSCVVRELWLQDLFANGLIKLSDIRSNSVDGKLSSIIIENADLGKMYFNQVDFSSFTHFCVRLSTIIDCQFTNITWHKEVRANTEPRLKGWKSRSKHLQASDELLQQKEAYRQLKYAMNKQGDYLQEMKFHILEMRIHYYSLKWFSRKMGDKFILWTSWLFSNYGQRMFVAILWMLGLHLLFTLLWIGISGDDGLEVFSVNYEEYGGVSPCSKSWKLYLKFLNPVHKFEEGLTAGLTFVDLIMRLSGSYFLYLIIRASRKFIKGT